VSERNVDFFLKSCYIFVTSSNLKVKTWLCFQGKNPSKSEDFGTFFFFKKNPLYDESHLGFFFIASDKKNSNFYEMLIKSQDRQYTVQSGWF
jgi:hypothetical protein